MLADAGLGTYRKLVIENERLVGAVLYGDTADARWYLDLLRSGVSIEAIRQDLVFGRAFVERKASLDGKARGRTATTISASARELRGADDAAAAYPAAHASVAARAAPRGPRHRSQKEEFTMDYVKPAISQRS